MKISRKKITSEFVKKVQELSGENVYACYQCGKCSAGCPLVEHMDILPHTIIRLIQIGSKDEILESKTVWLCSTCLQCMAKCPKGVDVAKIMDTLREILKREGVDKAELKKIADKMWKKLPQQALVVRFRKCSQ
ncbi:MAG: 4Fe-4S dicluster domain-containing protein [Omnitrophica bacterium]|nr:4Fe-4S dicluster domain-containing protein [Candidatus Omnitrophota bacterium]